MPLVYKIPGYVGNALLLILSAFILGSGHVAVGLVLGALAALNVYLVYKLDQFSREEVWLAHEIQMAKLREELLLERKRVSELEKLQPGASTPSPLQADKGA
jgi:hypothetical protein